MSQENQTENEPQQSSDDNFAGAKAHARQAADEFRAAAESKARELRSAAEAKANEFRSAAEAKANEFRGQAQHAYGEARERVADWQTDGESYIRQNPMRAVGVALLAGFTLGLLFRR